MDFITYIKLRDELSYDVVNYVFSMIKKVKMNDIQREWPTKLKQKDKFKWSFIEKLLNNRGTFCPDDSRHFTMYNCWCNERRHHYASNTGYFGIPTIDALKLLNLARYC